MICESQSNILNEMGEIRPTRNHVKNIVFCVYISTNKIIVLFFRFLRIKWSQLVFTFFLQIVWIFFTSSLFVRL